MTVHVRIAYRNALRNWRKSLATIVSIAAGFVSLVLFRSYIVDVERMYDVSFTHRAMYGHFLIENKDASSTAAQTNPGDFLLNGQEQEEIERYLERHSSDIVTRVRFLPVAGTITNGKNSFLFLGMGYDVEQGEVVRRPSWSWDTLYGEPLHLAKDANSIVLGQALGQLLGCVPKNPATDMVQNNGYVPEVRPFTCESSSVQLATTTLTGQINALDVSVVGLIDGGYKDIDQRWLKLPLPIAQTLLNTEKVRFMSVYLKDPKKLVSFLEGINSHFQVKGLPLVAMKWMDHSLASLLRQTQSLLQVFNVFIIFVILLIAGLSVFNTMVKNVKERTREIGTLRSIGYNFKDINFIFAAEAVLTCLLGIGLGLVLSISATLIVNNLKILYKAGLLSMPVLFQIGFDLPAYLDSTILLMALGAAASFLAIRSTLRKTVAENLTDA